MRGLVQLNDILEPLELRLREFLQILVGGIILDVERNILASPVRFGGLSIYNPTKICYQPYENSTHLKNDLQDAISGEPFIDIMAPRPEIRRLNILRSDADCDDILGKIDDRSKHHLELLQTKGTYTWLTTLPWKYHDFFFNGKEFALP